MLRVIVVSDTSPIRALAYLELVGVLREIFGAVLVPPGVQAELLRPGRRLQVVDLARFPFIAIEAPLDQGCVMKYLRSLDRGESEAIALALEKRAEALLVDERLARRVAKREGLTVVGTLAVLARAKNRGLIPAVLPLVDRLVTETTFFVGAQLRDQIRKQAGE